MLYTAQAACQASMQHNGLFKIYQIRTLAVRSFDFEKKVLKTKDWDGKGSLLAAQLNAQTAMMSDAPWTISSQAMLFYKASYFSQASVLMAWKAQGQSHSRARLLFHCSTSIRLGWAVLCWAAGAQSCSLHSPPSVVLVRPSLCREVPRAGEKDGEQ